MQENLTTAELQNRLTRFRAFMTQTHPDWDTAFILSKINQYYFTGTMQDGMLVIRKEEPQASYFVRRSYERATIESPLPSVYPMTSYRDAAAVLGRACGNTYMETEIVTLGILSRLRRHFELGEIHSLDRVIQTLRAVKSPYELAWMRRSGRAHQVFLETTVPSILREGISEADFVAELYTRMVKSGYQGISRFAMFQTEIVVGQVGFGENSLYPTSFDGPGGAKGLYAAVPLLGSRERKLRRGDLVFVDIGFGMNGYHSDKTQVYQFGRQPSEETLRAHRQCIAVQQRAAALLQPGAVPAEVYQTVMRELSADFLQNFMGFGQQRVAFLGHGIGLHVDEPPVIAEGFRDPLLENMVIALEPKKGIPGVGMVGVEDTYVVTPDGGQCITGGGRNIIVL